MSDRNRVWIVMLAAAVLFVMFSSVVFIAAEADHDCIGEDCPVCYQISVCENTLKSVRQLVLAVVLTVFSGVWTLALPLLSKQSACCTSLVARKVKLSN